VVVDIITKSRSVDDGELVKQLLLKLSLDDFDL
jgi:hypothetical protein